MLLYQNSRPVCVLVWLACLVSIGCDNWRHGVHRWPSLPDQVKAFEEYHTRFGEIAVTKPFVVAEQGFFKIDFELNAKQLYDDVTLQVAAKLGTFDVASFKSALTIEAPTIPEHAVQPIRNQIAYKIAERLLQSTAASPEANASLLESLLGVAAPAAQAVTVPEQNATDAPELPENDAAARAQELAGQAKAYEGLSAVKLRARDRITEATNAFYHMRLHELSSDPGQLQMPGGIGVHVLVGNISVMPGTVTKEDFIAEVTLRFVAFGKGTQDPLPDEVTTVSVFPSAAGQNMEIESLSAYQRDIALQLKAMGYSAAANALAERSRLNTADIKSANQRISISSFARRSALGFRIRGEYMATNLDDYRVKEGARPVVLLQDINVPFVVMVAARNDALYSLAAARAHVTAGDPAAALKVLQKVNANIPSVGSSSTATDRASNPAKRAVRDAVTAVETAEALDRRGRPSPPSNSRSQPNETAPMEETQALSRALRSIAEAQAALAPDLQVQVETRWVPATDKARHRVAWCYPELGAMQGLYRAQVADRLEQQLPAAQTPQKTSDRCGEYGPVGSHERQWYDSTPRSLAESGLSAWVYRLPKLEADPGPDVPRLTSVCPISLPINRSSVVVVTGRHLEGCTFLFGPVHGKLIGVFGQGQAAVVEIDPIGLSPIPPGAYELSVTGPGGTDRLPTSVRFDAPPK
ncbi:MAG TPA: hypothetical protein PKY77_07695 [Phycisphaerae bacterium]|nr:hypothetical protein [Phycisphaerae bacterium]HRY66555.1 hypothetical protein [Phycisphaerae bacterium]HSA26975.1 hypothetical protein [Phycisphaerae bacterium]